MADRIDDDREAVAAISNTPPRKSQPLRPTAGASGGAKRTSKTRNHSLDDERIASMSHHHRNDSSDDDFFPRGGGDSSGSGSYPPRYDHSLSLPSSNSTNAIEEPLPEFTASGGVGIFKPPSRAAVHPNRPAALELRPHPLRETQIGRFLKTIGCTETQLWAGQESGVRFWNFRDAYDPGIGIGGRARRGDEHAAPFYESASTPLTLCLIVDEGSRLVLTGHKDGKIRSWKMDQELSEEALPFREGLSWAAHKAPVLSMAISSYGDLWSGSENGVIKIWPWESMEKSLSLSPEEKHMAALLVERASIDLKSQVTVNGVCSISSSDVKVILSDHARGKMWDARTRDLIKVFNIDGHIENRVEMLVPPDQAVEDEIKVKFVSKKEKPQGFLQRSRNALMGAADAVRRVATRGTGAFNEDSKKTEAMVLTADGTVWSGCSNGLLVQWDGNGNRLQDFNHHPVSVLCFCTHGSRLWVGYATGVVQLLDLDGNLIAGWVAHSSPVIKMAVGGGYVFSLATHGGIRGWSITSPGPIDSILRTELASRELLYMRRESFKILVGTWNVGQGKPPPDALRSWLGSAVSDVGIVVVGLQEVEMGAGFLAMSAAKETVGLEGSAIGNHWQDAIGKALDEGPIFERVGSRQLAGLLIAIWVRKNLRMHVGDLDVAAVACGLGRTIGNKVRHLAANSPSHKSYRLCMQGGVGLRLRVHDRILSFVNCHLAAHLEAVNRRNADFDHIFRTMVFSRQSNNLNVAAAGASATNQVAKAANPPKENSDEGRPELSEADMVVFCGDFNYRLFGISYDEARDLVSQRSFDWLREKDQLRAEMKAGRVFQGMREAVIRFPPTYKFERHKPGLGGYDSGEKKRIPAWCDRVIYRDCRTGPGISECDLDCPIIGSVLLYEACMDVTDSDHKPVRCKLSVRTARVDRSVRRKEFGDIMKTNEQVKGLLQEYSNMPETAVSTDSITLQSQETCSLCISNKSQNDKAAFRIICQGQSIVSDGGEPSELRPRGSFGFPTWLEVTPSCGIIRPEQAMEVTVRHTESHVSGDIGDGIPQNWWSEDTRDREAVLVVQVRCTSSTQTRAHQIHVRYCYSAKACRVESRTNSSRRGNPNGSQHRRVDNSDMVDRG